MLEKELGTKAVHLPMGQSSDHAHLPNERIRLTNLEVRHPHGGRADRQKGQAVVRRFLSEIGAAGPPAVSVSG